MYTLTRELIDKIEETKDFSDLMRIEGFDIKDVKYISGYVCHLRAIRNKNIVSCMRGSCRRCVFNYEYIKFKDLISMLTEDVMSPYIF